MLAGVRRAFELNHLEGTYDATCVVRMDKARTLGVKYSPLLLSKSLRLNALRGNADTPFNRVFDLLAIRKVVIVDCGSNIQPRAARQNAGLPCAIGPLEQLARISLKQSGGIRLARIADVNAVMRRPCQSAGRIFPFLCPCRDKSAWSRPDDRGAGVGPSSCATSVFPDGRADDADDGSLEREGVFGISHAASPRKNTMPLPHSIRTGTTVPTISSIRTPSGSGACTVILCGL